MDPSSLSNSIRFVLDFLRIKFVEILEDRFREQIRVDGSDTVDGVGADNSQIGHTHLLVVALLDK